MTSFDFLHCSRCGSENPPSNVFCGICGSRLDSTDGITLEDLTEEKLLRKALEGKFQILEELGRGGFGVVFRAEDLQLGRHVAIKVLHLTKSGDKALVHRFIKEARLSAKLEHPNIARIYTIDFAGFVHYFVMEYITGPTIKQVMIEQQVFSAYHTVKFGQDMARALAFAHDNGIIHRDIKPANVILKNSETAVVTDFGIAKALWSDVTGLTTGAIGTPVYMAPEQFRGEDLDGRTDQYSLGILFYEMLTGDVPFAGTGTGLIQQHLSMPPSPLRQRNPEIPEMLEHIVLKMLQKNQEDRYPDCRAVLRELEGLDLAALPREGVLTTDRTTWEGPTINQLVEKGREALERSDYIRAYEILNAACQLDPDNEDVREMLSVVRLNKGRAQEFERYVKSGIAGFHDGRYTDAIAAWEEALSIYPANTELPKLIERARKKQQSTKRGEELKGEGIRALEQQRFDTAVHRFNAARELLSPGAGLTELLREAEDGRERSEHIENLLDQAQDLRRENKLTEAIALYREVLKMEPGRKTAEKGLREVLGERASDGIGGAVLSREDKTVPAGPETNKERFRIPVWLIGLIIAAMVAGGGIGGWMVFGKLRSQHDASLRDGLIPPQPETPVSTVVDTQAPVESATPVPTLIPAPSPSRTPKPSPPTPTPIPRPTATPVPKTPGEWLMDAQRLHTEKHYRKALVVLKSVLNQDPDNAGALRLKYEIQDVLERSRNMLIVARRLAGEGNVREAREIAERVLELDPFNPALHEFIQRRADDDAKR
ncbi:protein kinase [bacterium]|nr:protein kinase [candidate division CSSED10-310 bacterium]